VARARARPPEPKSATSRTIDEIPPGQAFQQLDFERAGSFFMTGGLVAVHSDGRDRDSIWNALQRREVYGDERRSHPPVVRPPERTERARSPMGGAADMRARRGSASRAGSFEQKPGCPEDSVEGARRRPPQAPLPRRVLQPERRPAGASRASRSSACARRCGRTSRSASSSRIRGAASTARTTARAARSSSRTRASS
jgi:hypothetical protein